MPDPDTEVVGYLCLHEPSHPVIRPGYQCPDDEPVRVGDTVHTEVTTERVGAWGQGETVRLVERRTSRIERGDG